MRKVVARPADLGAAVAVLPAVLAGTAYPSPAEGTNQSRVAVDPPSETRTLVVGTLSFGLMIAAVFSYTGRHRRSR